MLQPFYFYKVKHTSVRILCSICHLHVLVARSRLGCRRRGCRRITGVLGRHTLEVHLNDLALEDAEVTLRSHPRLVRASRPDDANGRVVDRELLVLLQCLPKRMQAVLDQLLECAWVAEERESMVGTGKEARAHKGRTVCEALVVLLEVCLRTL